MLVEEDTFKFHPRCKSTKLHHLCFADDLMLFCKVEHSSIQTLCECWQVFFQSSGLQENFAKSAIYLARIGNIQQKIIMENTQLSSGKLPFRYLGIPLNSKRLSIADCDHLVDKMTSRIRGWKVKNLSYAARLQLVNVVLMSIPTYWCQIFILPKMVIKKVNAVCCAYLWNADHSNTKPGLVRWEHICKPKKERGLDIRNLEVWNMVAIGKTAWHISRLSESLWVRWIHDVYTKGGDWRLFDPSSTASWALRKLCKVKEQLHLFLNKDNYVIKDVYKEVVGSAPSVCWCRLV